MSIIQKPVVTEKMTAASEKLGSYGFIVDKKSNKLQIKKAIESTYSVTVESVRTMSYYGKKKVRYTKTGVMQGRKNQYKKAVVTLKKGDTIDFFNNI